MRFPDPGEESASPRVAIHGRDDPRDSPRVAIQGREDLRDSPRAAIQGRDDLRDGSRTLHDLADLAESPLLRSPEMQACGRCGTSSSSLGRYCPACGEAIDRVAVTDAELPGATAATGPLADAGTPPPTRLIGCAVGDFEIDAVIGGGSFGTVYRGRQRGLDRLVAIKVPTYEIAADPVQARRFAREARAAARIVHPGVVAIYAVGELADGRPYLAMQLIDGAPLVHMLADGPVPAARALRVVRDIASALSETHAAGVVHRDLKPSNVMWHRDRNGDDRITLVDFGIAVCRPGNADATRLTTAGLVGTPHYMSPELAQGELADARSDLYALGCLLFELVTGTTPFDGSGLEVLLAHINRPVPLASERNPEVPAVVDRLIERLMQKLPADRPDSADVVVAMLDEAIDALGALGAAARSRGAAGSRPERTSRTSRSGRRAVAIEPVPGKTSGRRWPAIAVVVAIAALGLSGAGFAALRLRSAGEALADEPEPSETPQGQPVSASGEALQRITHDDGELILRTLVPQVIHAGAPITAHIEIRTKLGAAFRARQVVVTIEDPRGNATGLTAAMHGDHPGHYVLHHTFAAPGSYVVRVFPSETESVSTIELTVVP
ncbi:MAG TPA: serine/threonine-protein kinase [Kofleriaceae bacterium]|nr:serine/threonine-protein kinase [Kofleriaceae bacterium]